jgi:hypothetical protein
MNYDNIYQRHYSQVAISDYDACIREATGYRKQLDLRRVLAFLLPKFTDILGCRSPILAELGGDPVST